MVFVTLVLAELVERLQLPGRNLIHFHGQAFLPIVSWSARCSFPWP